MNEQQYFRAYSYAEDYISKNSSFDERLGAECWGKTLQKANGITSILECGRDNRTPTMIEYQGEKHKLFKRDFGKLFIENFDVSLMDYDFLWGHLNDSSGFDDITWRLFEKR